VGGLGEDVAALSPHTSNATPGKKPAAPSVKVRPGSEPGQTNDAKEPDPNTGWRIGEGSDRNVVIIYEPYLLHFERETSAPFEISTWPLTAVGRELAPLITVEHNWNYVKRLAAEVEPAGWRLAFVLTPCGFPPPPDLPTQTQPR